MLLPPAGVIPLNILLEVSGSPATDPTFLYVSIRDALDRQIRPTLRSGASVAYGPIVPWPLFPLATGGGATVNVTVSISSGDTSVPVTAVTTVTVYSVAIPPLAPCVLFLSDDPEYLQSDGLVFRGDATRDRPARLYYYHSDIGAPRDVDVILTVTAPARVQIISSEAGPDLDVMSVGHTVSRDLLRYVENNEGTVVDIVPGKPFIVRHALILQGEVIAGAIDVNVVSGQAVALSVVVAPAGSSPSLYLAGPRVAYDGHGRHGMFDLAGYGNIAASYTVGGPSIALQYGGREPTPHNLVTSDDGHDYGDYGVTRRITFTLVNPTDTPQLVYLYEKPLGGATRSSFLVDGQPKELDCVRVPQPYTLSTYQLLPHSTGISTMLTMTDGGSFYPVEVGATNLQPIPNAPSVGTPDGCSPKEPTFPDQSGASGESADFHRDGTRQSQR